MSLSGGLKIALFSLGISFFSFGRNATPFVQSNGGELRSWIEEARTKTLRWYEGQQRWRANEAKCVSATAARETELATSLLSGPRRQKALALLADYVNKRTEYLTQHGTDVVEEFNLRRAFIGKVRNAVLKYPKKVPFVTIVARLENAEQARRENAVEGWNYAWRAESYRGAAGYISLENLSIPPLEELPKIFQVREEETEPLYVFNNITLKKADPLYPEVEAAVKNLAKGEPDINLSMDSKGQFYFRGNPFEFRIYTETRREELYASEMRARRTRLGREVLLRRRLLKLLEE